MTIDLTAPVRLDDVERAALAVHLPHQDWCDYDEKGGCEPHFGCGVWKARAALETTVERLIAARLNPPPSCVVPKTEERD